MKESDLRDMIAKNIDKIKPGLILLKKEQYIPSNKCTKSFIDLYAKDKEGNHVLIELKCNNSAARQAIHEVNKYVETVKQYLGVKDSEIHVIIASIEWSELLLPFSRFCSDTSFSVEGLRINLSENNADFEVETIEPFNISNGRLIAPWHNVYWYKDEKSLQDGISQIEKAYRQKNIEDYVIVRFYLQNNSTPEERQIALQENVAAMLGKPTEKISTDPINFEIPKLEYFAYTALQTLSREKCLEIIGTDKEYLSEIEEYLPDMDEEEALCTLHEYVEAVNPSPQSETYEIGYPAKFKKYYENCKCLGIIRHGTFKRNTLLTDNTICDELCGEDGSTGQSYKNKIDMQNLAHIKTLKNDILKTLDKNPVWKNHILQIIDEIQQMFPKAEIDIRIFNPSTGLFTIYYALTKPNGELYLPNYYIIVKEPDVKCMYFGSLESNGTALKFNEILEKYYDSNITALLMATLWGGTDDRDSDIVEDLGAQYRSFKALIINNSAQDFFTLKDSKWRNCENTNPLKLFNNYVDKNSILVNQIISKIGVHDKGVLFDYSHSENNLEDYIDMITAQEKSIYYSGCPEVCDICKCEFSSEKYMIDGKTKLNGAWANMCADCFYLYGTEIACGSGQLYKKHENGWLLVGGFCDETD